MQASQVRAVALEASAGCNYLAGREDAFGDEHSAVGDAVVEIDAEGGDGSPARSRAADEAGAIPAEVPRPFLAADAVSHTAQS